MPIKATMKWMHKKGIRLVWEELPPTLGTATVLKSTVGAVLTYNSTAVDAAGSLPLGSFELAASFVPFTVCVWEGI